MRRVLMVAYHFPPLGGAGVQRNLQLARGLPAVGYLPTVVTGPGRRDDFRWTPTDGGLGDDRLRVPVHRVPGPEPALVTSRMRRWFQLRHAWETWWGASTLPAAVGAAVDADVVHASVAP